MELYDAVVFVHVVLFVYWLGPDFGVYVASPFIVRPGTPLSERVRFLTAMTRMAQLSRNCLILLLPVGFWLAARVGLSSIDGWPLAVICAGGAAWCAASVLMYRRAGTALAQLLAAADRAVRIGLIALLPALAAWSLVTGAPLATPWLALKVLLFAFLLFNSLQQRAIALQWRAALDRLRAAGEDAALAAEAEAVFARTAPRANLNAYLTWAASLAIAFLGVVKPG
ncbi:MAG: hypothetical protein SFV21_09770 [Rhodospirillaceae bacterium]|nr:hypothetical protein [Rhodospirillaceae bacterium]